MGLLRSALLLKKKNVVKDKFHLKKSDGTYLKARNDRCILAARLLPGSFVFLDSAQLGTTKALAQAGIQPQRMFPVNGLDRAGFCKNARKIGARPAVSMFDEAPKLLIDWGVQNVQLCYNDGTHGDPDKVWMDMKPWIAQLPAQAYVAFTGALRSRNAVPFSGKFGLVTMLASHGFEPPGGWRFLKSAFTYDSSSGIFNVHMTRGITGAVCEKGGLCKENGYSFDGRYARAECSSAERLEDVQGAVKHFLKKSTQKTFQVNWEWESLRKRVCSCGLRGEARLLDDMNSKEWIKDKYLHWARNKNAPLSQHYAIRFPKRLKRSEAKHWKMVGRWVEAGLNRFRSPNALVVTEMHPNAAIYRMWLAEVLPEEVLRKTLCVGDSQVTPGIKASTTKGTCFPARLRESVSELGKEREVVNRFGRKFSLVFVPLFTSETYEEVKETVEETVKLAAQRSLLVLSVRSPSLRSGGSEQICVVAWVVWLISHLAENFNYKVATFCEMCQDGGDLMDFSRIVTVVLSRGV